MEVKGLISNEIGGFIPEYMFPFIQKQRCTGFILW
jgi:hypothetical protein